jgi:cellulose synthase/poly-beta-1,6-N-acetylglucosamine synthase-like glycosyltransferase
VYAFIVEFTNFIQHGQVKYFLVFFFLIWLRWFIVNVPALRYEPYKKRHNTTKSVVIPVVDEDPEVFRRVLSSINKQKPNQIIVVINGPYNAVIKEVCKKFKRVECHWTPKPGKRNAIRLGMGYVTGDITILVDSDTVWEDHALYELMKPFADPEVGGVTTRQRISNPTLNLRNRICDWLEDIRMYGTVMAMSVNHKVGCLPGRTIAFRSEIIRKALPEFMEETFLGFHKEVSDDRSMTNFTLRQGYQTVLQNTSVVYTQAPESWRKYVRQQLRWAEGSQYNNLRMSGWMLKNAKLMFFIFWTDTLIPFLLWGLFISYAIDFVFYPARLVNNSDIPISHGWLIFIISLAGAYISYTIRQLPAIVGRKSNLIYIPIYILFLTFVLAPIRMIGFAKLADDLSWGTRNDSYRGHKEKMENSYA